MTDFEALLRSPAGADVRFVIVGGFAGTMLGSPRTTVDLERWPLQLVYDHHRTAGALQLEPEVLLQRGARLRASAPRRRLTISLAGGDDRQG
jgi:hypothetical protein